MPRLEAPPPGQGPDPAVVFAALGDPTRLHIVADLSRGGARSIAKLSADTHLTRQAVTKHLHVLELAGLVQSHRIGRESLFSYRPERVDSARAYLDRVSAGWDEAMARFKAMLENGPT